MKKVLACVVLISFLTLQTTASPGHDDRCRNLKTYSTLTQVKQVELDLVNGVWNLDLPGHDRMIEFESNGIANMIEDVEGEIAYTDYLWTLKSYNNSVILYLTTPENDSQKYVVSQNCAGIELNALDGSGSQQWEYEASLHNYEKVNIEEQLIGTWKSIHDEAGDIRKRYNFREDGTLQIEEEGVLSSGVWELTEDGEFILISLEDANGDFTDHLALRIYDIGYHAASFTDDVDDDLQDDIQYFVKI